MAPRQLQLEFYQHDPANPASIFSNAVNAMYAAPDGTLWVGTVEGGLNASGSWQQELYPLYDGKFRFAHNSVSTLAADNRGISG